MSKSWVQFQNNLSLFLKIFFPNRTFWEDFQKDMIERIDDFMKTEDRSLMLCIVAAKGVGKTDILCLISIWVLFCFPSASIKMMTGRQDQTKSVIFGGIYSLIENSLLKSMIEVKSLMAYRVDANKRRILEPVIAGMIKNEKESDTMAGIHKDFNLIVMDEAATMTSKTLHTVCGVLATGRSIIIVSGNSTSKTSLLYDVYSGVDTGAWVKYKVSSYDVKRPGYNISAMEKVYTPGSIENEVMMHAEFAGTDDGKFFDSNSVEAVFRDHFYSIQDFHPSECVIGVDPATGIGADSTVFTLRCNQYSFLLHKSAKMTREQIVDLIIKYSYDGYRIVLDVSGCGGMLIADLRAAGVEVKKFLGGRPPIRRVQNFKNLKSQMYYEMKEAINEFNLTFHCNPKDIPEVKKQFYTIPYDFDDGKMDICNKNKMTLSPDILDSLSYTFYYDIFRTTNRNIQ